jgi:hypothetical protein
MKHAATEGGMARRFHLRAIAGLGADFRSGAWPETLQQLCNMGAEIEDFAYPS